MNLGAVLECRESRHLAGYAEEIVWLVTPKIKGDSGVVWQ